MTQQAEAEADDAVPAQHVANGVPSAELLAGEAHAVDSGSAYEQQLAGKIAHVRALFTDFTLPQLQIFRSAPDHYRLR
jgi:tRNA (Uracil-5-)-methyltransferase